ncbi:MAG: hypothetical protein QN116_02485, partial [Armatimonadota bacterium]|nr:hypothetical protein [Armatimonadota bacterium]
KRREPGGPRWYNAGGMATDALEVRMARLEGSYEQLDKRLGDLGADLQALRAEFRTEIQAVRAELQNLRAEFRSDIQGVRGEMQAVRAEMGRLFYWLMGTFLTVLVGIGGTLVTVLLRTR